MLRQRRVLWFALFFSTVIYAVVAYALNAAQTAGTFEDALRRPMVMPLYGFGLLLFLTGLFGFGALKAKNAQAGMIVRLALFEACAIMGLLATMLAHDWRLYLPAWAVAAIGFIREWPGE